MKTLTLCLLSILLSINYLSAQNRTIPVDTTIITSHTVTINGNKISYTATTGMQPVWDESGKAVASLQYTYYRKSGNTDMAKRPLLVSYNGGPGSASAWMHMAYTSPMALNIDAEGYPLQPYGVHENEHSVFDVTDIVYVNPINTGYSRMIPADGEGLDRNKFFGINADIKYLAEWLNTFVNRHNRWLSPKFIIGESYGGTRVSGLALELQDQQWMYLNGVILVSPADYKAFNSDPAISSAINLPYYAATAWHHKVLPDALQQKDLLEVLPEVEDYAINKLMPAIAKGGFISEAEKQEVAEKMAYYSGLSKKSILQHNLDIPSAFFWKELLRDKTGNTIGRLDSRYLGLDKTEAGVRSDFNAEIKSWLHTFTPAINYYLREHLNFKTDIKYNMFGSVRPWNNENNNTRDNLRQAMAENPYLNIMFQTGYYDGACTYFNSKYTMWQIDPSGKLKDRMYFKGYRSGHMMYLRNEDLKASNDDLREFILKSLPQGKAAKY